MAPAAGLYLPVRGIGPTAAKCVPGIVTADGTDARCVLQALAVPGAVAGLMATSQGFGQPLRWLRRKPALPGDMTNEVRACRGGRADDMAGPRPAVGAFL